MSTESTKPFFIHFIGSSSVASSFPAMIERFFREANALLIEKGQLELPIPEEEKFVEAIPKFLEDVSMTVCFFFLPVSYFCSFPLYLYELLFGPL
jgi:hypothetical protein